MAKKNKKPKKSSKRESFPKGGRSIPGHLNPKVQDSIARERLRSGEISLQTAFDIGPQTENQRIGRARTDSNRAYDDYFDLRKRVRNDPEYQKLLDRISKRALDASGRATLTERMAGYMYNPKTETLENIEFNEDGTYPVHLDLSGEKYFVGHDKGYSTYKKGGMVKHKHKNGAVTCRGGGIVSRQKATKVY